MASSNIKKVILIILDGFGLAPAGKGNVVASKNMPYFDSAISTYTSHSISASGLVVGMEWGTYGNSEVGHSTIGTGRVVVQSLSRINAEIKSKEFFENKVFHSVLAHTRKNKSKIHLVGCVSPGGIHSHENHLIGLLDFFSSNNFSDVHVHMITDGEDSAKDEAVKSLTRIEKALTNSGARIASVFGRNFAMDRVKNWPLTKRVWDAMVHGGGQEINSVEDHISSSYERGVYDPDIPPAVPKAEKVDGRVGESDGVIFFNFRNDRMRQLVSAFVTKNFDGFDRGKVPKDLIVATMTKYDEGFDVDVAYPPEDIASTLGEVISKNNMSQLRIAESEKEAHVTNFFDGGKLDAYPGEDRKVFSSKVLFGDGYLKHPELSLADITKHVVATLDEPYSMVVVNFANSDVIAHTGNIEATSKALKAMDKAIAEIVSKVDPAETAIIVTADHGNAEELIDPATGEPDTQHSTANVPIVFINDKYKTDGEYTLDDLYKKNPAGSLVDVAPTILNILGIKQPKEMSGSSLIR